MKCAGISYGYMDVEGRAKSRALLSQQVENITANSTSKNDVL
jgi:hypothetical protein